MAVTNRVLSCLIGCVWGFSAFADPPQIVADVLPVHSLVAQVTEGVTEPKLLLSPGISPHEAALRPSQARALQAADLVVWIGADLMPSLGQPIEILADSAEVLHLMQSENDRLLPFRTDANFVHEDDHDEHEGEHDEHKHDHSAGLDPHAWLDPDIAQAWLHSIAAVLSGLDPENAATYASNADRAVTRLAETRAEIVAGLSKVQSGSVLAQHDAYQYFERAFKVRVTGAISLGDGSAPSPARLLALQENGDVVCILTDPYANASAAETVAQDLGARLVALDPLGSEIPPGVSHHSALLRHAGTVFASCSEG